MDDVSVDISGYRNRLSPGNRIGRAVWGIVWFLLFRPSPVLCFAWRRFLLRLFGARIGKRASIYPSTRIWAPWNLEMGEYSCLSHFVDCFSVDKVRLGGHSTVSQYSYLCTASHDISDPHMELKTAAIEIGPGAWVCARAYVGPGVRMGDGAVAAAGAVVVKDVPAWTVVGGNPAREIGKRTILPSKA